MLLTWLIGFVLLALVTYIAWPALTDAIDGTEASTKPKSLTKAQRKRLKRQRQKKQKTPQPASSRDSSPAFRSQPIVESPALNSRAGTILQRVVEGDALGSRQWRGLNAPRSQPVVDPAALLSRTSTIPQHVAESGASIPARMGDLTAPRSRRLKRKDRSSIKLVSTKRGQPFPFFRLPRELRDIVYDLAIFAQPGHSKRSGYIFKTLQDPRTRRVITCIDGNPAYIAVSHQYASEFVEALQRAGTPHHLYLTLARTFRDEPRLQPAEVGRYFRSSCQATRIFLSVGLVANMKERCSSNPSIAKSCIRNVAGVKHLMQGLRSNENIEGLVVEWASCLHGEVTQTIARNPFNLDARQDLLDEMARMAEGLPKMRRYLLVVHQDAVYAAKQPDGSWRYEAVTLHYPGESEREEVIAWERGPAMRFLKDMGVQADRFPVHQDLGAFVWRYGGLQLVVRPQAAPRSQWCASM